MHTHRIASLAVAAGLVFSSAAFAQPQTPHDAIVVVLDASGSMDESMPGSNTNKMESAKGALIAVLGHVPEGTWVGVLVFSGHGMRGEWVYPLKPLHMAELKVAVAPIGPSGGTPLGDYIKKGADRLLVERERQSKLLGFERYRLLVVTDGEAEDPKLVNRYVPDVLSRGITLDVIGVAMDKKHTLATQSHSYRSASNPHELERALAQVFAEVGAQANDQTAGSEAYAAIAGMPVELATTLLKALHATAANHPIGETPPRINVTPQGMSARNKVQPNWDSARSAGAPGAVATPPREGCSPSRVGTTAGWAAFLTLFTLAGLLVVAHRIE